MSIVSRIINAFSSSARPAPINKEVNVRAIVQRHARGNVNLQLGRYITAEDLETRRKKFLSYNFSN
jgi:hypothetical protein